MDTQEVIAVIYVFTIVIILILLFNWGWICTVLQRFGEEGDEEES